MMATPRGRSPGRGPGLISGRVALAARGVGHALAGERTQAGDPAVLFSGVFGGMGSWNDLTFGDPGVEAEYGEVSRCLYAAILAALHRQRERRGLSRSS
jgi:hypothetical protein